MNATNIFVLLNYCRIFHIFLKIEKLGCHNFLLNNMLGFILNKFLELILNTLDQHFLKHILEMLN
jgi:hypothetical protein